MTTFADTHGDIENIAPISVGIYQGTSPEWLAAIARVEAEEAAETFRPDDCILITDAGLEALRTAVIVPDAADMTEDPSEDPSEALEADCGAAEGQGEASEAQDAAPYFVPDTKEKAD